MAEIVTRSTPQVGAQSYVEWGAVFAGATVALAVSLVLLSFGAAIGLSSVSPWTTTTTGLKAVGVGAAFWMLLVTIWSFALGGYLAGRMRHRWSDATLPEMRFRDSAHGLLVWAVAIIGAAALATAGVSAVGKSLGAAIGSAASAADQATATTDLLFRSSSATGTPATADTRSEVSRILLKSAGSAGVSTADRTYLAQLVASRTGLSQVDAEKRVTEALDQMKAAADRARKIGIVLGFLTASILLIGGVSAWWAANVGGKHREEGTVWHGLSEIKGF